MGHVEKDKAASKTLQLREAYYYFKRINKNDIYVSLLNGEISFNDVLNELPLDIKNKILNIEINDENLEEIFNYFDRLNKKVDGIIGGPPCQAYSTIGRAKNAQKKGSDNRIYLYRYYISFLKKYSPNFSFLKMSKAY
ncbi:DNA (cytosine-5-)-methyltransferase family protein [Streptococcus parauberis]|nr:DNA (cytosine-5-)-methyltransferase family protein [Streptococcus parauberis]